MLGEQSNIEMPKPKGIIMKRETEPEFDVSELSLYKEEEIY